MVKICN
jgi:hypothetical protein